MSRGPLAVRFGAPPPVAPQAGTVEQVRARAGEHRRAAVGARARSSRTTGSTRATTRSSGTASGPARRRSLPASVRPSPSPCARRSRPGRYRLAFDLVAELRAWFSELGSPMLAQDVDVAARAGEPHAASACGLRTRSRTGRSGSGRRTRRATAVVAGAVDWPGGLFHRRPRELAPYVPGPGPRAGLQRARSSRRRC